MREFKWYIKQFLLMQIKLTVMMLGITYLMSKLPDQQYSIIPTWTFGIMILMVINIVFPLGFLARYKFEWKPMIHEKYSESMTFYAKGLIKYKSMRLKNEIN